MRNHIQYTNTNPAYLRKNKLKVVTDSSVLLFKNRFRIHSSNAEYLINQNKVSLSCL